MARLLLHHMSLVAVAPAIISLLLLLAALGAPAAATAGDTPAPAKKVRMRIRHASKEEAQWLDRYAETHQPLGAGPLRMVRATPEEYWLKRLSDDGAATTESHDGGEDGAGAADGGDIEFDDDNPYVDALRAWVLRLTKQSMEKAAQAENNPFQDL